MSHRAPCRRRVVAGLAAILAYSILASCQVEVSRRDHWAEKAESIQQLQSGRRGGGGGDEAGEPTNLRIKNADGSITLNCFLPEHLVGHLRSSIALGEADLIYDQLLSDATKQAYVQQQRDAHEAVQWLMTNQRDVIIMLGRMSAGLSSPDVSWQSLGNTYRMEIVSPVRASLRFTRLDLISENGQFRLLLIS